MFSGRSGTEAAEIEELQESAIAGEGADLMDMLLAVVRRKRQIAMAMLAGGVIAAIVTLLLPNEYVARAKILPPQQNQSLTTVVLGQLGPLAGLTGSGGALKNSNDIYLAMLKSRTLGEKLIDRFKLMELYKSRTRTDAVEKLESQSRITNGRDQIITLEFKARDPNLAASVTNAYVEELIVLSQTLAVNEAAQRRVFFEGQLNAVKAQLEKAEIQLKSVQESTGMIQPDSQARALIESAAGLRAQIAATEVKLQSMRIFATENNPDYLQARQELAGLKGELSKLQREKNLGDGDIQVATRNVPDVGLRYLRSYRDVKYYEALYQGIARQYELARFDEAKTAAVIQVLDPAVVPEKKSWPPRTLIVLGTMLVIFVGMAMVIIYTALLERTPEGRAQLRKIRQLRESMLAKA